MGSLPLRGHGFASVFGDETAGSIALLDQVFQVLLDWVRFR